MKKLFLHILVLLPLIYLGCDKPAPTELIDDEGSSDNYELEIIGKEIDNEYYSNGYDTSGVTEDFRRFASIVYVSGIKLTRNNHTDRISVAQAIFFDKSRPVYSPNGDTLGYNTFLPGIIKFDSITARISNLRVFYRENNTLIDTVLGKKYELFNLNRGSFGDPFNYPFNSNITVSYNPFIGQASTFTIPTPREIFGNIKFIRLSGNNRFRAELEWEGGSISSMFIIVGGVRQNNNQVFPFYKIKTVDDGRFVIPATLFEKIPRDKFNKLSLSFMRKNDGSFISQNGQLHILSQSIHTIIIDIP